MACNSQRKTLSASLDLNALYKLLLHIILLCHIIVLFKNYSRNALIYFNFQHIKICPNALFVRMFLSYTKCMIFSVIKKFRTIIRTLYVFKIFMETLNNITKSCYNIYFTLSIANKQFISTYL